MNRYSDLRCIFSDGACAFFPGAGVDGVVLPFLAAAYEEHDQAEDEHDRAPGEVEVDAHRTLVDARAACDEAENAHDSAGDEEDEAEGDADVESHVAPVASAGSGCGNTGLCFAAARVTDGENRQRKLGEDEVEDDQHGEDGDGEGCGLLVPAQVGSTGLGVSE